MKNMKEVGSDFKINICDLFKKKLNFYENNKENIFLSSGRDSLEYVIDCLKLNENSTVLLPSYLCDSVSNSFLKNKIKILFYKINSDLTIDLLDFKRKINLNPNLIVVIHYFGFIQPSIEEIVNVCKENKILLIEDLVQSPFTEYLPNADFSFNSYRKVSSLPEGSLLRIKNEKFINQIFKKSFSHFKFFTYRTIAGFIKNIYFLKFIWRRLYIKSEEIMIDNYAKPAKMSRLSKYLLGRLDLNKIKSIRRNNYLHLKKGIKSKNVKLIFKDLPLKVCPMGLPLICEERNKLKQELIKNKVYPPVHWKLPSEIKKDEYHLSHYISDRILTIPIDQRYNIEDMDRILRVINNV